MRLAFAMFADSADATPEGKVFISGGGLDVLQALSFPATHPVLTLVMQLLVGPEDKDKGEQLVTFEGTTPSGELWLRGESAPLSYREPDAAGRLAKYNFIIKFAMLPLPLEGKYTIRVKVSDQEIATLPLWADLVTPSDGDNQPASQGEE